MPEAKQSQSPQATNDSASDAAVDPPFFAPTADSRGTAATLDGEPLSVRASELPPAPYDWERYETLGLLGKGGMGAVYKARDSRLGRIVALKFIRGDNPLLTQRLLQEARAQSRIEHDHVCKVHEVGEIEGHAYIAMQ